MSGGNTVSAGASRRKEVSILQENLKILLSLAPKAPEWTIDWNAIENTDLCSLIGQMKAMQQNPAWHGEGDVWTHTRMACEELVLMEGFRDVPRRQQEELFLAMLLHDIGKIPCTKMEDGVLISPNHTAVGARMARELLWTVYGLCGTEDMRTFRETICNLIRYHSVPLHVMEQEHPERRLLGIAANGELAEDFYPELLCIFSEADVRGRISDTKQESVETVRLCAEFAEEAGVLKRPYDFPTAYSKRAYLSGRTMQPDVHLYDDTWGEVILLSGLPGTGKDTWIRSHCKDLPVVSLDALRKQMDISPKEEQGTVVNAARGQAKEYLRKQQPFVWNATNLTPSMRGKLISLFENYHASVRIVFLETAWKEEQRRNESRREEVPAQAIRRMLRNLVLPERFEAQYVEWHCV